jgi:eukaryotic-like serine/threonine-protein kinase
VQPETRWIVQQPALERPSPLASVPVSFVAAPSFGPGTILRDTYRILKPIGAGGMGRVFSAEHRRLPGLFAVKALHKEMIHNETAIARFRIEAQIMASLRHPNIVQVIDFDVAADGTPYMVMEFLEGRTLGQRLRAGETMTPIRVGRIVNQIARALDVAHRRGIIHRDLKPDNVMLSFEAGRDDLVKVIDFGISKAAGISLTVEESIVGTPQFMAPEQAQGRNDDVDPSTDQFALACIAYTLLAGVEPFKGGSALAVLYQVVHEQPPSLSAQLGWACPQVEQVILKGLAKSKSARFSSVLEFSAALAQALGHDLRAAAGVEAPAARPIPLVKRKTMAAVRASV